ARTRMYGEGLVVAALRLIGRNRRRYGGYIVHFGVVILFCAFAGLMFKNDLPATLKTGESVEAKDAYGHTWKFTSQGISRFEVLNRSVVSATFAVTRDGKSMGLMSSEKRQHVDSRGNPTFEPSTEVAIMSSPSLDVYLVFTGAINADTAAIHITFNPLVWWVWYGGIIMAFGGLIVMWPQAQTRARQGGYVAELPAATPDLVGAGD
ncbi:MAG: cytochrome c-type biogenesis CcmF C-terminal domain-containing protein, partial [Gemmatimonadaceae bacterium]